jgi:hypothetical protein
VGALAATADRATAQFSGPLPSNSQPLINPNLGTLPGNAQMSPQQLQSIMMMRALQGRGHRGVQTGIPQNIPMGSFPGMNGPSNMPNQAAATTSKNSTQKSSSQKRTEARQARDEQRRAARDEAKAKKAKTDKAKTDKSGKSDKQAKANAKLDKQAAQ